jgi:tetratricopeptide (TPR) repeat protein
VQALQQALRYGPLSSILHAALAYTYHAAGNVQAAERVSNLIRLDPDLSLGRQLLGEAYARQGRRAAAIAELQKAVDLSERSQLRWHGSVSRTVSWVIEQRHSRSRASSSRDTSCGVHLGCSSLSSTRVCTITTACFNG